MDSKEEIEISDEADNESVGDASILERHSNTLEDEYKRIVEEAQHEASDSSQVEPKLLTRSSRRNSGPAPAASVRDTAPMKRPSTGGRDAPQFKSRKNHLHQSASSSENIPLREDQNTRRSIIDQQNQAYIDSLIADQEKDRLKEEEDRKKREAIKAEKEQAEALRLRKLKALENLPEEPADNEAEIITLILRLPSGATMKRNFRPTETLFTLYNLAASHDATPLNFDIVRHPNEVIPVNDDVSASVTLQEYGFKGKEVLHVRATIETAKREG